VVARQKKKASDKLADHPGYTWWSKEKKQNLSANRRPVSGCAWIRIGELYAKFVIE
jgi:hypothetical protein